jgi:hypothetical protein
MKISKIVNYLGWASGIFGGILMLCGVIGFLTGAEFLGVKNYFNFFFISMCFILLGIFFLVGTQCCCCCCKDDKCCNDEGK